MSIQTCVLAVHKLAKHEEVSGRTHWDVLEQWHLTENLNVPQLVKIEVSLPFHIVNLQLQICYLQGRETMAAQAQYSL